MEDQSKDLSFGQFDPNPTFTELFNEFKARGSQLPNTAAFRPVVAIEPFHGDMSKLKLFDLDAQGINADQWPTSFYN